MAARLTLCPPASAHSILAPEPIFFNYGNNPVAATYTGTQFSTTGISFDDYSKMNTQQRKQSGQRRLPTPEWALNNQKLQLLLARFFERRCHRGKTKCAGTPAQRLRRADKKLRERVPGLRRVMDNLCAEYFATKQMGGDPARLRVLASEIESIDTLLRIIDGGPGIIARIVHLYYSVRLDSVGVGLELGIKPPHVRQTLYRLSRVWEELETGKHSRRKN